MATQRIALGEWLPDQPSVVGTLQDAFNVVPIANGDRKSTRLNSSHT